jgi:hypothetical protein
MAEDQHDYKVGRRPPLHSRFQTGQSGNPGGRSKKKLNALNEPGPHPNPPPQAGEGREGGVLLAGREVALRDAVPSRNGSTRDAPGDANVFALAWSVEADAWTTDRDFAGTGVASWSTPNLMRALIEGARDRRSTPGSE